MRRSVFVLVRYIALPSANFAARPGHLWVPWPGASVSFGLGCSRGTTVSTRNTRREAHSDSLSVHSNADISSTYLYYVVVLRASPKPRVVCSRREEATMGDGPEAMLPLLVRRVHSWVRRRSQLVEPSHISRLPNVTIARWSIPFARDNAGGATMRERLSFASELRAASIVAAQRHSSCFVIGMSAPESPPPKS